MTTEHPAGVWRVPRFIEPHVLDGRLRSHPVGWGCRNRRGTPMTAVRSCCTARERQQSLWEAFLPARALRLSAEPGEPTGAGGPGV
jgi:hypothetical protein